MLFGEMTELADTIAAIATAPGEAGIAIVRVSGPEALAIADSLFRCVEPVPSVRPAGSFVHGFVQTQTEHADIDEALLLIFRAPHSYTREDVVEFHGHGGYVSARRILQTVVACGARVAEPGEFTKRAFLNGRIDLLQAEAVADLIRAKSDGDAAAAMEELEGSLSLSIQGCWRGLICTLADLEAFLDFEDGELAPVVFSDIENRLRQLHAEIGQLLDTAVEGRLMREGAVAVISGQPNVGKSTLLNSLVGSERAIVTHHPGTTRDTIEEQILIDGVPVRIVDTAGLREAECDVEREGVRRAQHHMAHADVNLHVLDGSRPIDDDERQRLAQLDKARTVVVVNKTDLGCDALEDAALGAFSTVPCALITGEGVPQLRRRLLDVLRVPGVTRPHAVIAERHRAILQESTRAVADALERIRAGHEEQIVLAAASLRLCLDAFGALTGRTYTEETLEAVFSRFCVGK